MKLSLDNKLIRIGWIFPKKHVFYGKKTPQFHLTIPSLLFLRKYNDHPVPSQIHAIYPLYPLYTYNTYNLHTHSSSFDKEFLYPAPSLGKWRCIPIRGKGKISGNPVILLNFLKPFDECEKSCNPFIFYEKFYLDL